MRVGLLVPGFSADEQDWCVPALRSFVQVLSRTDDVQVFALRYPGLRRRYGAFGADVQAFGGGEVRRSGSLRLWQEVLGAVAREHRARPFDVLHAFWANETGLLAALAGRLWRIPAVVSVAGGELVRVDDIAYGGQRTATERMKVRLALTLARVVTAGSRGQVERASGWLRGGQRAAWAPLGVDLTFFPRRAEPGSPEPLLVQVASLVPVKNATTLIEAIAHLARAGMPARARLIGSGPLEAYLRARAREEGIETRVQLVGARAHDRVGAAYETAAAYVQTSRHEAQGMAVLEAAARGLPILGTSVGVVADLAPGAAVALVEPSAARMAKEIGRLLSDPEMRRQLGRAGRERVESDYECGVCVQRFRAIYRGVRAVGPGNGEMERTLATSP